MSFDVELATAEVARRDPVMAAHIARAGPCQLRPALDGHFAALCRSICYQQLAGPAAAAIHARFQAALGGDVKPERLLAVPETALRGAGLSRSKVASMRDLAIKVTDGVVPLGNIESLGDDEIVQRLSVVRGIGRWTAEMFLIFQLRRPDVWPVDDYGVRSGYGLIYGLPAPPVPKELAVEGERFRPFRTVAAWYCWEAVHMARRGPLDRTGLPESGG